MEVLFIIISCTLFNHLGLAETITFHTKRNLIINCTKCLTFWSILSYKLIVDTPIINSIFIVFISSYLSLWIELLFNFLNKKYLILWQKISRKMKIR